MMVAPRMGASQAARVTFRVGRADFARRRGTPLRRERAAGRVIGRGRCVVSAC
jgi:hypothetical protein